MCSKRKIYKGGSFSYIGSVGVKKSLPTRWVDLLLSEPSIQAHECRECCASRPAKFFKIWLQLAMEKIVKWRPVDIAPPPAVVDLDFRREVRVHTQKIENIGYTIFSVIYKIVKRNKLNLISAK